jgi:O-methyltransferase
LKLIDFRFHQEFRTMALVRRAVQKVAAEVANVRKLLKATRIYQRYQSFTMIPSYIFESNLLLCEEKAPNTGCIVEAGVWRGGMSAGIADMVPARVHYLFDSFEGLPPAKDVDGATALAWQHNTSDPAFYDNCRAERSFAEAAMARSRAKESHIVQGWFNETMANFKPAEAIAILRLDGDWYDSTMQCLTSLYPYVMEGGVIIIDDYYAWDGCARALHDYLSAQGSIDRIEKWRGVCYLIKRPPAARLERIDGQTPRADTRSLISNST